MTNITYYSIANQIKEEFKDADAAEHVCIFDFQKWGNIVSTHLDLQVANLTGYDYILNGLLPDDLKPKQITVGAIMGRSLGHWAESDNYIIDLVFEPDGTVSLRTGHARDKIKILNGSFSYISKP